MKKLGERNYLLISQGTKSCGTFDPVEILFRFEEDLYVDEVDEIEAFLRWCHGNDKAFGSANYEEVFAEYKKAIPTHKCDENAVPYESDGPLGHGFECGVCGKFLQAG